MKSDRKFSIKFWQYYKLAKFVGFTWNLFELLIITQQTTATTASAKEQQNKLSHYKQNEIQSGDFKTNKTAGD